MKIDIDIVELNYLLFIIEQNLEDYEDSFGILHKENLDSLYSKLIVLKQKLNKNG
tara:strand:- start:122 stop:286 length:165 start_codon:yes stop_codon:yes gene_type:complete